MLVIKTNSVSRIKEMYFYSKKKKNKNSAEGYVAPGKDHVSMACDYNCYS